MALATAIGLRDEFEPIFVAPDGPVHQEAKTLGFKTILFRSPGQYVKDLAPYFVRNRRVVAIGTRVIHTLAADLCARLLRNRCANIQVVHGGADELLSYQRKRWLRYLGVKQVAVSNYVKQRMTAYGADETTISVIENFLTRERIENAVRRGPILQSGLQKAVIISRLDPIKRVDLLMEAIDLDASLRSIEFEVYGRGYDEDVLQSKALAHYPNVKFMGFRADVAERICKANLLLHLCPEEPFGLAILEAMAARLPVLVPNAGGAGAIVEDGRNGFHFKANDPGDLARKLQLLRQMPVSRMQSVVDEATNLLRTRFSADHGIAAYRRLIHQGLQ